MKVVTSAKIRRDLREHLLNTYPQIDFAFHPSIAEAEKDLTDADVLITYGEDLTDRHIAVAEKLQWIMVISAGLDKMPFEAIKQKGITVTNATGIHAVPMAEYALAVMLQTARQTKTIIEQEKNKLWDRSPLMTELHNKTVLIIGAGQIGTQTARLTKAFNMKTLGVNRTGADFAPFDEIIKTENLLDMLPEADFIVSVLPKTPETDGLLDQSAFAAMKKEAVLINMGRGNVIHETDLIEALNREEFSHAVLDVFNEEPLPADHPFWEHPDVTVTPHISGISPQYQPRALEIFEYNLAVYERGHGTYWNWIDLNKGY
ncbi:D-2-hydroxyacid dehydrogenase [Salisediminibacterium halotolerans]|uniref:Phosphoglycerate dehydrogenase n=1 Tax=Salisediminibacterium halotolerans TaxID=517425 RepID=A0A1H9WWR4_9BACI|nr:D-2-hydroxyacid dehydrogenase [Salisediminibacterium haloalkalitolerans]SES38259.1 Phosphoglycerate dehydrogenase [Salisediminibacterium haloalkalitolerans]